MSKYKWDVDWLKVEYLQKGRSTGAIADDLGCGPSAVGDQLRKLGVLRSPKGGLRIRYPKGRFGKDAAHWAGGRHIYNGYMFVYDPTRTGQSIQEHRLVMEQMIGRPLLANEIVHHKDGNRLNNTPENLEMLVRGKHVSNHFKASHEVLILRQEVRDLRAKLTSYEKFYGSLPLGRDFS